MYVPAARERVLVAGRKGVYLVVWVDRDREEADLIPVETAVSIEEGVSFSELQAYSSDDLSRQSIEVPPSRSAMYVPQAYERVFVAGQDGEYLVVWVDEARQVADLIPLYTAPFIRGSVAFSRLRPCDDALRKPA